MHTLYYPSQESDFETWTTSFSHCILVVDAKSNGFCTSVAKALFPSFHQHPVLIVPDGEENKNTTVLEFVYQELFRLEAHRHTLLLILGGGVLSDLVGYAAATYKRGIPYATLPTTLTAMADAAYGGKTGINFHRIKNSIGCFYPAQAIYINPVWLRTLSENEVRSGYVEMIKHALLDSEWLFQNTLNQEGGVAPNVQQLQQTVQIKMHWVAKDPLDKADRQALNIGHSMGHALESWSKETNFPLRHGEAVLLGLILECSIAERMLSLSPTVRQQLLVWKEMNMADCNVHTTINALYPFLVQDKKNDHQIRMPLLADVGNVRINQPVPMALLEELFAEIQL
jgi:3-dehydroquinate synthase